MVELILVVLLVIIIVKVVQPYKNKDLTQGSDILFLKGDKVLNLWFESVPPNTKELVMVALLLVIIILIIVLQFVLKPCDAGLSAIKGLLES